MPLLEALAILRHGTWGLRPALHARLLSSTGLHAILLLRRARLVHATVHVGVSRVCHGVHLSVAHVALAWHLRWQHLACLLLLGLLRLLLLRWDIGVVATHSGRHGDRVSVVDGRLVAASAELLRVA